MTKFYSNALLTTVRCGVIKFATRVFLAFLLFFAFNSSSFAQLVPELSFQNPALVYGTNGADGAVYRFSNVAPGIDALVTIVQRSSSNVTLVTIDNNVLGAANAFQPQINYTGNNRNQDWYMDLAVQFVLTGSFSDLPAGSGVIYKATAYDIDGDGVRLREYIQAFKAASYQVDPATELTVTPVSVLFGGQTHTGTEFYGPVTNYTDIDLNAPKVSATLSYLNQSLIGFRVGVRNNTNTSSSASSRYSSILFNNFIYIAPGPLPVNLLSFTAKLNNSTTVLDWVTANEVNFSHFVIQRSTDGRNFTDIATVAGKQAVGVANTNYSYSDKDAIQNNIVYYRLKMVDLDATSKYSDIKLVNRGNVQSLGTVLVYPNPVASELRVTIPTEWQGKKVSYTIYNSTGLAVMQRAVNSASQTELFYLSGIATGIYTVRVTKDAEAIVKQFVKN